MSDRFKSLSAEAKALLSNLQAGLVLWFSDAGEYPDRFWLESAEDEFTPTGQLASMNMVTELRQLGLVEPESGEASLQRWRLVGQGE